MPGAQPRHAPFARLASGARRGAHVPVGVPGVYRVTRRRAILPVPTETGSPGAPSGWIQGPDYTITLVPDQLAGWLWTTIHYDDGIDDASLHSFLRDGVNLTAEPSEQSVEGLLECLVQTTTVPGEVWASAQTLLQGLIGAAIVDLFNGETLGDYIPPVPDPGWTLEYEAPSGRVVGDLLVEGLASAGDATGSAGGSLWVTSDIDVDTFYTPADLMAAHDPILTWPEQSPTSFSVPVPADVVFPVGADGHTMHLHVMSETLTDPATAGRLPPTATAEHLAEVTDYSVTFTIRPPRYRLLPPVDTGDWILSEAWDGYIWDAGEYLPSSFDDLIGHPVAIPSGASELYFYVDGTTLSDFPSGSLTQPFAAYWIDGFGNGGARNPALGTPDAGAHLWVVWHGPTISTDDPVPGVSPSSLVPASLAENGTG